MNTKIIRGFRSFKYGVGILMLASLVGCGANKTTTTNYDSLLIDSAVNQQMIQAQYQSLGKRGWDVTVNKPINLCQARDLLYVKLNNHSTINSDSIANDVIAGWQDSLLFRQVITTQPIFYINVDLPRPEHIRKDLYWYDTVDPLTVGDIRQRFNLEDFVIADVTVQEVSQSAPLIFYIELIDPNDGGTILTINSTRRVWFGSADNHIRSTVSQVNSWFNTVAKQCANYADAVMWGEVAYD